MVNYRATLLFTLTLLVLSAVAFVYHPTGNRPSVFDEMSRQQRHQTGIDHLDDCEKRALHDWILENYIPKEQRKREKRQAVHLSLNMMGGKRLLLSNGHYYDIEPLGTIYTSTWVVPSEIDIKKSNDPEYPLLLINLTTLTPVKAKPVSKEEVEEQKEDFHKKIQEEKLTPPPKEPDQTDMKKQQQKPDSKLDQKRRPTQKQEPNQKQQPGQKQPKGQQQGQMPPSSEQQSPTSPPPVSIPPIQTPERGTPEPTTPPPPSTGQQQSSTAK